MDMVEDKAEMVARTVVVHMVVAQPVEVDLVEGDLADYHKLRAAPAPLRTASGMLPSVLQWGEEEHK